ncbi:MAG: hypothetical protein HDS41_04760 [Bacteroides sp.]|nr:hypothetical protein [Bacteroides sp.]
MAASPCLCDFDAAGAELRHSLTLSLSDSLRRQAFPAEFDPGIHFVKKIKIKKITIFLST